MNQVFTQEAPGPVEPIGPNVHVHGMCLLIGVFVLLLLTLNNIPITQFRTAKGYFLFFLSVVIVQVHYLCRELYIKTLRESRKAALRISHLLQRCQVFFTKICHYYYCPRCYCRYCHYYYCHKYYYCHCHYCHYCHNFCCKNFCRKIFVTKC